MIHSRQAHSARLAGNYILATPLLISLSQGLIKEIRGQALIGPFVSNSNRKTDGVRSTFSSVISIIFTILVPRRSNH